MKNNKEEIYATLVEIKSEPTELYKILKFANIVCGGGEAKLVISEGYVSLNGEVETRKRKKIYAGDLISFNEAHFQIALKGQTSEYEVVEPSESPNESKVKKSKKTRKAISF